MLAPSRRRLDILVCMATNDQRWAATAALIATHQSEELVFSMKDWKDRLGLPGDSWLYRRIEVSDMASLRLGRRARVVALQAVGLASCWALTRRSTLGTRMATSALTVGWAAGFTMHIVVSARTRSAMPGLATSLVPGLPGAAGVIRFIWS